MEKDKTKIDAWVVIQDNGYFIKGKSWTESVGYFHELQKGYQINLILFQNQQTGEIKAFRREFVDKIGSDNILKDLNK